MTGPPKTPPTPLLATLIPQLAVLALLIGCGGADTPVKRQLEEMEREIQTLRQANDRLQERMTSLELASAVPPRANHSGDDRPSNLEVVHLGPQQGYSHRGRDADSGGAEDDSEPPTVIRLQGNQAPYVQRGSPTSTGHSQAQSQGQAAQDYERALLLFRDKKYEQAQERLAGFLVRYPGHENADSAMYWRGECFFAMGNYVRAAEQFEGVVARFPRGNKVPDALLKLGMSQRRLGENDNAARNFETLRRNHPNSDAASKIPRD
ncbi:MAG: tol-pal system protein YbgF [Polyangiaceae bacterium]|nr:tol-pal system protein YbgF [Polyangiaceae bacterium]